MMTYGIALTSTVVDYKTRFGRIKTKHLVFVRVARRVEIERELHM
jgi:hypothetical protein